MKKLHYIVLLTLAACLFACGGPKSEEVTIRPLGNQMKYMTREVTVKSGTELTLTIQNTADQEAMVHNIVVVKLGGDVDAVAAAALTAPNNEASHPDVLVKTAYAKPGETASVTFTAPEPGTYTFLCTYPGHQMMRGVLIVE